MKFPFNSNSGDAQVRGKEIDDPETPSRLAASAAMQLSTSRLWRGSVGLDRGAQVGFGSR
jgi:hypothetical protein